MTTLYSYEKCPGEIYRQSFDIIRTETDLSRFSKWERQLVIRLIHASGMVDLADDIVISPGAVEAGVKALGQGAAVICDVEMVRRGIIERNLHRQNVLLCGLGREDTVEFSNRMKTTRSAGGIEVLKKQIPGAIVTIGNAPTALFHLLELLSGGLQPPALIIGCPVGFVGAVESKQALIEAAVSMGNIPYITVQGRRGGSAMAAASLNALAILSGEG
ncbi:MAG: precorrin-8X methylmutase [Gammaproteobacteria bacterium]|nr:precorrin-8X methylmutase [Gammaproteobacteria bacterium]